MFEKKVVILQSNYIPWKGYFDLINAADEFVFLDDVQYTSRDWRNRNKIKTADGWKWLTIPVGNDRNRKINEVEMKDQHWREEHKRWIELNYSKAASFEEYRYLLNELYDQPVFNLSEYNQRIIKLIAEKVFFVNTRFTDSGIYQAQGSKTDRLIDILKKSEATEYITGPSAKAYIDESLFKKERIKLTYFDYSGYPEYPQLFGQFIQEVTVLDLIFNTGKESIKYMKTF